jgi:hypothetical protein
LVIRVNIKNQCGGGLVTKLFKVDLYQNFSSCGFTGFKTYLV